MCGPLKNGSAPLGLSHDGQNAGVFGSAARKLVDDPFGSHLGSRLANGHGVYSNHPPLLNWLLGIGHAVTGDNPAGLRVPMVIAALVLIAATYRLLRLLVSSPGRRSGRSRGWPRCSSSTEACPTPCSGCRSV